MRRITIPTGLLATSLGALALAAPASAVTTSQLEQAGPNPSEAWLLIAQDNLRDLQTVEAWQRIAQEHLRDLRAVEAWQRIAQDNLRDLRAQERPPRPSARKGHRVVWRGGRWRQVPLAGN